MAHQLQSLQGVDQGDPLAMDVFCATLGQAHEDLYAALDAASLQGRLVAVADDTYVLCPTTEVDQ
eukprot:12204524-Prorocentrum_lima.AAC.1